MNKTTLLTVACVACLVVLKLHNDKIETLTKKVEELSKKGE